MFTKEYTENDLLKAVATDNIAEVIDILNLGISIDLKKSSVQMALPFLAASGNLPMIELLIEKGVVVNAACMRGYTALHYAAIKGGVRVIECLIAAGANVNDLVHGYKSSLSFAIDHGHIEATQFLLSKGASINHSVVESAISKAVASNDMRILSVLLAAGLDVNARYPILYGYITSLLMAVQATIGYIDWNVEITMAAHIEKPIRSETIKTLVSAGASIHHEEGDIIDANILDKRIFPLLKTAVDTVTLVAALESAKATRKVNSSTLPFLLSAVADTAWTTRSAAVAAWKDAHPPRPAR